MFDVYKDVFASILTAFPTIGFLLVSFFVLFNISFSRNVVIRFILIAGIMQFLIALLDISYRQYPYVLIFRIFTSVLLWAICAKYILKVSPRQAIIATLSSAFIITISYTFSYMVLSLYDIYYFSSAKDFYTIMATIGLKTLLMFIMLILGLYYRQFKYIPDRMKKVEKTGFLLNLSLIVFIACTNIYYFSIINDMTVFRLALIINLFLLSVFVIVSFANLKTYISIGKKNAEIEVQVINNEKVMEYIDETRRMKHSYNNTIYGLYSMVKAKNWNKVEIYLNELTKECSNINSIQNIMMLNIKNAALLGLLSAKSDLAVDKGVTFTVECESGLDCVNMKEYVIYDILGCLLDNAIEASVLSLEKHVKFGVFYENDSLVFQVENSYLKKPDIHMIFEKGYSTKGENRGLGLWSVRDKVKREKNLEIRTFFLKQTLVQELTVYNAICLEIS